MKFININVSMLKAVVLAASLTAFSGPASAILIGTTEVGSEDDLIGAVNDTNSGLQTEEELLESFIGGGADVELVSNVAINDAGLLSDGTYRAIDVSPSEPGYYVLKFGAGNECAANSQDFDPNCRNMFFFANLEDLNYLVWANQTLIDAGLPSNHVQSISHYAITEEGGGGGGGTPSVPEPASILLVASGLIALGGLTRRFRKSVE
jgi:PEP-CTERM motif-containing protein